MLDTRSVIRESENPEICYYLVVKIRGKDDGIMVTTAGTYPSSHVKQIFKKI